MSNSIKCVFLGNAGVGKSSIVLRIVRKFFTVSTASTVAGAFFSYGYKDRKYDIWDTAGQERFNALIPLYLRNFRIAIFVFDLCSFESFNGIKFWIDMTNNEMGDLGGFPILIGNKLDMADGKNKMRAVFMSQVNELVQEHGMKYFEVSAKTGENTGEIFDAIDDYISRNPESRYEIPESDFTDDDLRSYSEKKCMKCALL